MTNHLWADYPFPLISTPALNGDVPVLHLDQYARSATKMALTHNVIIRGMNSVYLQCEYITPENAASFLLYCQCWAEFIQNHHACEEVAYFPIIEKATGIEGLSEGNLEQHDAFLGGLQRFEDYIYNVKPENYSGQAILEILDSFAATLQSHLTDEVVWIMALSRFQTLDLAAIDNYHRGYVRTRQSQTRIISFMLTNHDVTYEAGIHAKWPFMAAVRAGSEAEEENTPIQARVKNVWLRYFCTMVHSNAWSFSCCSYSGRPRKLEGTKWARRIETADRKDEELGLEMDSRETLNRPDTAQTLTRPEKVKTRGS